MVEAFGHALFPGETIRILRSTISVWSVSVAASIRHLPRIAGNKDVALRSGRNMDLEAIRQG
jgi:hypothetical protein